MLFFNGSGEKELGKIPWGDRLEQYGVGFSFNFFCTTQAWLTRRQQTCPAHTQEVWPVNSHTGV